MSADVLVIGGGVVGCCVAFELAAVRGARVLVLERAVPGAEASTAAAGILGAQIESHEIPAEGRSTRKALFDLLLASRERHRALDESLRARVGLSTGYRICGSMRVTRHADAVAELHAAHLWQRAFGQRVDTLDALDCRALEAALSSDVVAGVHLPDDGQVDPPALFRALQLGCASVGVVFRAGALVRGVTTRGDRVAGVQLEDGEIAAENVVVCAGSWSSLVGGLPMGARSVRPVRGQIVQVDTRPPIVRTVVVGDAGYVVARPDGRTLLGSTMEEVGHVKEVTAGGVHEVLTHALALVPALATAPITATWAGFRPATRGEAPMLGSTSISGLFVATGHHRNGILLAPETGRLIASLVATGTCDRDLSPFAVA